VVNNIADGFERYYLEKIWEMIPAYYRHEDGIAENPHVMRALVEIIAKQASQVRRSHDQLWQDQFIEQCRDWAVPYIGDLLATRMLSSLNARGQRVDVAKTIYYRRRKGTLGVLEELIGDITGWEGKITESFKRLARAPHGLDPKIVQRVGLITQTPAGGVPDFRQTWGAPLSDSPFDEFHHTPDFRQHRGHLGRYNIPKLGVHIYRIKVNKVENSQPFRLDDERYSFDPSGRDIQLFSPRVREDNWHNWRSIASWHVPAPIVCRLLNHSEYRITERLLIELENDLGVDPSAIENLRRLHSENIRSEARLSDLLTLMNEPSLSDQGVIQYIFNHAIVQECGKYALLPNAISIIENNLALELAELNAAGLDNWPLAQHSKRAYIDPEKGRYQIFDSTPQDQAVNYHYGLMGDVGAGTYARAQVENFEVDTELNSGGAITATNLHNDGTTQINDNATYGPISDKLSVRHFALQAANFTRPYIVMETNWVLRCANTIDDSHVRLNGLWFASSESDKEIIFRGDGDYETVTISHCTLDPGGSRNIADDLIWPVRLVVETKIEKLRIEHSIVGQILLRDEGFIEHLEIIDSIVDVEAHVDLWEEAEPHHSIAIDLPTVVLVQLQRTVVSQDRIRL